MARLRKGRANTARGRSQLRDEETVARVRHAGATGALTVRADSGFYAHVPSLPSVARWMSASPSPSDSTPQLRNLIEAIPETDWTPGIPYWMDGAADVRPSTIYAPFQTVNPRRTSAPHRPKGADPRPAPNWRSSRNYSYHGFITDREGDTLQLDSRPPPTRRGGERHPRPEVRRRTEPSA